MDIMKALFDQDEVTRGLLEAKYEEGVDKGIIEGRNEGRNEANEVFVRNGRKSGLNTDMLVQLTGLSKEEIMKIQ